MKIFNPVNTVWTSDPRQNALMFMIRIDVSYRRGRSAEYGDMPESDRARLRKIAKNGIISSIINLEWEYDQMTGTAVIDTEPDTLDYTGLLEHRLVYRARELDDIWYTW